MGVKIVVAIVAVTIPLTASLAHADDDISRGEKLFALRGTCHGTAGQGDLARGAPALAGLERWYVEAPTNATSPGCRCDRCR